MRKSEEFKDLKAKVTGEAQFTSDIQLPGMLVGKALYPSYPRARIMKLDTSAAKAIPGVLAVVTHRDLPHAKFYGPIAKDQPIFAIDEVHYIGDMVGAVAAITEEIADQALNAIDVAYEPIEGIFDAEEALRTSSILARRDLTSNILAHHSIRHGDVERGFSESSVIARQSYRTQCVEHLFLETESVVAEWDGDILTLYISGQDPHSDRNQVAEAMGLPTNRVRVIYPYVGGGFGGKEEMNVQIQTALLALKTSRPVKFIRSREESLHTHIKRQSVVFQYATAAKADGTLTAVKVVAVGDSGPYSNLHPAVMSCIAELACGPYKVPNAQIDAFSVATNNLLGGGMRGFGSPEIAYAYELNMDFLAAKLGMDPVELRLKNGLEKGTIMPSGACISHDPGLKETIRQAAESAQWFTREKWLDRKPEPRLRRGIGIASVWHPVGIGRNLEDHSGATVEMFPDGTVLLSTGTADLGQGTVATQASLVATELGIDISDVRINPLNTDFVPSAGVTAASRSTYMMGNAILDATRQIRESLLGLASEILEANPAELVLADKRVWVKEYPERFIELSKLSNQANFMNKRLRAEGFSEMWHPPEGQLDFKLPNPHSVFAFATDIAQVLVDIETGLVTVEKIWAAHDVGRAMNRKAIEGQIEGGIAQGVGYALYENLQQERGRLINSKLSMYIAPMVHEVPEIEPIIVEFPVPSGPNGATGVGEPTLTPVAPAISNAIADAVGVRFTQIPMTPERVLNGLRSKES